MSSSSTLEQLYAFHAQDREIFSKLVLRFSRPLAESLLVMATWLWFEDFGFKEIISTIMALSDPLIATLADEAVLCIRCLDSNEPPDDSNQIPLTVGFMTKDISLRIIYQHRYSAITGIKNFLNTVCSRIFSDILQRVLPSFTSFSTLIIPGFPHPTFGGIKVMPNVPEKYLYFIPNGLWGWNANCIATRNDRTVFLTFSRGYPVSQEEVMELFTKEFGENSVECVYMREDNGNMYCKNDHQQSLYARLVLDSVATVDRILNGENVRKLHIFKKHIWARKYQERLN